MAGRLEGKIAFITGAGSVGPGWGNGRATAIRFAQEGAKVFATDIDLANLDEILVKPWQIVCKGQKVCGVNGKRYALGDNYPDYILVKDILAKHGDSLTQNEGLFTYLQLKPNF